MEISLGLLFLLSSRDAMNGSDFWRTTQNCSKGPKPSNEWTLPREAHLPGYAGKSSATANP